MVCLSAYSSPTEEKLIDGIPQSSCDKRAGELLIHAFLFKGNNHNKLGISHMCLMRTTVYTGDQFLREAFIGNDWTETTPKNPVFTGEPPGTVHTEGQRPCFPSLLGIWGGDVQVFSCSPTRVHWVVAS